MVRKHVSMSEWHPVFFISEAGWGYKSEFSPEEVDRIQKALVEFEAVQVLIHNRRLSEAAKPKDEIDQGIEELKSVRDYDPQWRKAAEVVPARIWADMNMGIWLGGPQPDRRPYPPIEFVRADIARQMADALQRIDESWLEDFPQGPDGPRNYRGFGVLSDWSVETWKAIRAALGAFGYKIRNGNNNETFPADD